MEIFESIGWIAFGFIPTLVGMEITWRIAKRRSNMYTRKEIAGKKVYVENVLL